MTLIINFDPKQKTKNFVIKITSIIIPAKTFLYQERKKNWKKNILNGKEE